jgi:hypothetical protein
MILPVVTSNTTVESMAVARARYCYFTTPTDGETVSGTIDIDIAAYRTPKLYIDGVYQGRGLYWTWDTTQTSDGVHVLEAKAPGVVDTISVTVDNGGPPPPPPNEAPVVTITNPTEGSEVSDTVTITVTVDDDQDTLVSDIYIDGTFVATANSYNWDTTGYADGAHTIYAEATDSGDLSDSDSVSVTVDNTVPPPPPPPDGDDMFYGTVSYFDNNKWHYVDAGFGMIDCELTWDTSYDVDMYLYRPSDYNNYVVRAYTVNKPEYMSFDADENGLWGIKVVMYTSSGIATDYELHVTYTPNTPDTTAPTCTITKPTNGETVYKTVYVTASATDDRQLDYVNFYIDGSLVFTDSAAPYSYPWDTTAGPDGGYTIDATAFDMAGNSGDAAQVAVTVDQSAAPETDVQKYAVIVGISDYKAISDLSYCDEDASDWYNFITSALGVPTDHITVLGDGHTSDYPQYDGIATEANIKAALNNYVGIADDDDELFFITSGHGSGNGNWDSYICAWDCGSGESGEDGDFYDYELAAILGASIADKIFVFVDHCYSGGMGDDLMACGNAAHILVATTCTEDGYGWDDPGSQNGLWTHWFLEQSWIGQYGSDPTVALEDVFQWAHDNYPKSGGDEPQLFDGDSGTPMVI